MDLLKWMRRKGRVGRTMVGREEERDGKKKKGEVGVKVEEDMVGEGGRRRAEQEGR